MRIISIQKLISKVAQILYCLTVVIHNILKKVVKLCGFWATIFVINAYIKYQVKSAAMECIFFVYDLHCKINIEIIILRSLQYELILPTKPNYIVTSARLQQCESFLILSLCGIYSVNFYTIYCVNLFILFFINLCIHTQYMKA